MTTDPQVRFSVTSGGVPGTNPLFEVCLEVSDVKFLNFIQTIFEMTHCGVVLPAET